MQLRPVVREPVSLPLRGLVLAGMRRFTPAQLFGASEPGVWYDPSDFSTMRQDSAGTIAAAVDSPVGWIQSKVNGHIATQATAPSRPILRQDANGRYYLAFDGIDDSLATGSINFTSTDKVTLFAGVHKASDAALGILCELSVNANTNTGVFYITAPESTGASGDFRFWSKGSAASAAPAASGVMLAPTTRVLTGIGGISTDTLILRVDGTQRASQTGDQGTGTYGNYPLYIGRRNNASLPFNGRLYSLIVRGAASNDAQISAAERWVNGKTGAY